MAMSMSFFRPIATTEEKLAVLKLLLDSLPKPTPDSPGVAIDAYLVALAGVSQDALKQALAWALQGRHGSLFAPWPTELRKLCNEAEQPYIDELARLKRQEQIFLETPPLLPERTPEEVQRQHERMRRFYAAHDATKAELMKQFPKPEPPRKLEPLPRNTINPPDWIEGKPLNVTPVLLRKLKETNANPNEVSDGRHGQGN